MTRFRSIAPVFGVADVAAAAAHYELLGFTVNGEGDYRYARRDDVTIHLAASAEAGTAYAFVDDADALHAEWSALGPAGTLQAPADTGVGTRAGHHTDPDGNRLTYAAYVGQQLSYVPTTRKGRAIDKKLAAGQGGPDQGVSS